MAWFEAAYINADLFRQERYKDFFMSFPGCRRAGNKFAIFIEYDRFMDGTSSIKSLETIVYASAASAPMSAVALHALLSKARENNRANAITGMLLYADGNFMQVLEGPTDNLEATLARIRADARHTGMIDLFRGAIERRFFSEWSMGYRRAEKGRDGLFDFSKESLSTFTRKQDCSEVAVLLQQFFKTTHPHVAV